jgi:hypothetical protein
VNFCPGPGREFAASEALREKFRLAAALDPPIHAQADTTMADKVQIPDEAEERIPAMQHLLDNHFLLLFLGVAIPTVIYILWGVMEIVTLPNVPQ